MFEFVVPRSSRFEARSLICPHVIPVLFAGILLLLLSQLHFAFGSYEMQLMKAVREIGSESFIDLLVLGKNIAMP